MSQIETVVYAQILLHACRLETRINDIPVAVRQDETIRSVAKPIREYLISGVNTFEAIVEPDDIPNIFALRGSMITEGAAIRVRIAEFSDGETMEFDAGTQFANIEQHLDATTEIGPISYKIKFEAQAENTWAWTTAPKFDSEQRRADIDTFAKHVSQLYAARDVDALLELSIKRFRDDAKAYPALSFEERIEGFRLRFAQLDAKTWTTVPFDLDRAVYRSVANGRLVELLDVDGLPLIRTPIEDPQLAEVTPGFAPFPMMIGVDDNRFAILR